MLEQTDGRTPYRYIDPATHSTQAVPTTCDDGDDALRLLTKSSYGSLHLWIKLNAWPVSKFRLRDKVLEESTISFGDIPISLKCSVGQAAGSPPAKNHTDPSTGIG